MRFLLVAINAKYIHSNPAVYSLREYAGLNKAHVQIAEYTINMQIEEILADIYLRKPDVLGFSCYIWNWNIIQILVKEIKKLMPEIPIWLGGPEVTYEAAKTLKEYKELTGIMVGEGEETFKELVDFYLTVRTVQNSNKQLQDIKGLVLPEGATGERTLTDLSVLPFLYDENMDCFHNKILYYESQRGCPFQCSYCLSSIDKTVRFKDLEIVKRELQFFLDQRVKQVKFVDRTFNCNHQHAIEIWRYLVEHDNGVTNFHFEIAGDLLNEEELTLFTRMRPGLIQLEIGVQTTNRKTIEAIRRVMDIEKLQKVVAAIKQNNNIHCHLDLIAGLPFEDYVSFQKSFNDVYRMEPDQLQLGFLKVLKGSYMYEKAEEYGISYLDNPPYEVLFTKWISYSELRTLKKVEEMVELYYNSNQFSHTLQRLLKEFINPYELYLRLAEFYEEKGYFIQTPSRVYRYEVLLEFALRWNPLKENMYRELLTHDLYLRENMKSRPSFSKDLNTYRKIMSSFYRSPVIQEKYLYDYVGFDSRQMEHMTHLEPVSEMQEGYILYLYSQINPLNMEAKTILITDEEIKALMQECED